ncbi:fructosamine kinase family protein [Aureibaculum sp. 2210JD6-5]|uniref:fructosamine kinase family protein n=1 Tax=Aureibaculum sp. 2210JD6-5 TaxID=3103957 RepID=UPI002AAEE87C|nr:fructosamine kinase family protein [Aureibaculum sp. 2210JD6-5]MDY7395114.1 fructosamine kinase family protein [Aureibaculum sp. 2210JD6-5]
MESFINFLSNKLGITFLKHTPTSGGDISQAFIISAEKQEYFLKINSNFDALAMFKAEQVGLDFIAQTQTIKTPKIIDCGKFEASAYLLLEYIPSKLPTDKDFEKLGRQLASLHLKSQDKFGLGSNNFIGSLPQSNQKHKDWIIFYAKERLLPQFELAVKNNLLGDNEIPQELQIMETLYRFFGKVKPALLHGDLWSGNYLIATDGEPYLIDPAVYYGHNEVDIAMTKQFGGFPPAFYKAYHEVIPKTKHYENCMKLYQLYYLLVHLNLFGSSYYNSVKQIVKNYF